MSEKELIFMKNIKKIAAFIICLLLAFSVNSNIFATVSHVDVDFSSETTQEGDTFTATVSIDTTQASSFGISILCSENIEIVSANWLMEGVIASFDPVKNKAVFTRGVADYYSGDIFEITFRASDVSDTSEISILVVAKNGTSVVYEETVINQINVIPCIISGDVNTDGTVDSGDLELLMKYINFYSVEINTSAADVNGDGTINNKDYGLIQRLIQNN
jgi:hypothetical protein